MLSSQVTSGAGGFIPKIASQMFALILRGGCASSSEVCPISIACCSSPSPSRSEVKTSRSIG